MSEIKLIDDENSYLDPFQRVAVSLAVAICARLYTENMISEADTPVFEFILGALGQFLNLGEGEEEPTLPD